MNQKSKTSRSFALQFKSSRVKSSRAKSSRAKSALAKFDLAKLTLISVGSFAAATLALSACSVTKKLDGMYDSTKQLAVGTNDLSNKQSELYDALRQGNALEARRSSLVALMAAQDSGHKISEAGKYFEAFEFQLWSGLGYDTPERRDELEAEGAREFMRDVQEFITPGQAEPHPLAQGDPANPTSPRQAYNNRQASLNALSVAMHLTNPKQDDMIAREPSLKPMTMYMMIQNSLRAKIQIDSGAKKIEDYPLYVKEVLPFEDVARLLVQTRFNFFGAMLLASTSDIREGDLTKHGLPYWANFEAGKMRLLDWTIGIDSQGLTELQEDTLFMTGAQKVVAFMAEVGMTPKLDSNLKGILNHATYSSAVKANLVKVQELNSKQSQTQASPIAKAQFDFDKAFEMYRKH